MNATKASRRSALTMSGAIVFLLLSVLGVLWANPVSADDDGDAFVNGEVVVKLNKASGTTIEDVYNAYPEVDRTRTETFLTSSGIYLLQLQAGSDTTLVAGRMRNDTTRLIYAEPNYTTDAPEDSRHMRQRADSVPVPSSDEASYTGQYAVEALNLPEAHKVNEGAGTNVAVLDTGVQLDHPELAGSLVQGYDFIGDDNDPSEEPDGKDNDGDCPTVDCSYTYVDEGTGHGTHVAGIVHLTAPDAKIMPMRVLDSDGTGNVFVVAEAIQRAVDPDGNPRTDDGADVINMSFTSTRESNLLSDMIEDLEGDDDGGDDDGEALEGVSQQGVVVVASAGNDNISEKRYPAAGEEGEGEGVLSVTSVDAQEEKSDFANYDDRRYTSEDNWIDVAAPGDVHSLFPTSQYAEWDGTSMAAPFVAGQAALIRSMRPGLPSTGEEDEPSVSQIIETSARSLDEKNPAYSGKLGAGHADVYESLKKANTAPTISSIRPAPGSKTRDRTPLLSATVRDVQTDLAKSSAELFIDGRRIGTFYYNTNTDRLTHTASRLSYGSHKAKITARDQLGRSTTRTWGFSVVR